MIRSFLLRDGLLSKDINLEESIDSLEKLKGLLWIDIQDPTRKETERILSEVLKFNPLIVSESIRPFQYSSTAIYKDHQFVAAHGVNITQDNRVAIGEVDFVLGSNFLVSVHASPMAAIDLTAKNIEDNPQIMSRGIDWLLYAILDMLVDSYFTVLDLLSERIEQMEDQSVEKPGPELLTQLLAAKRDVLAVNRVAGPLLELTRRLSRDQFDLIKGGSQGYFRNVYDHMLHINESSESLREVAEGALTIYAMAQSNRTNEVIKFLSLAATVGLPPVIIASVYGMNFENMPEISWEYGYLFALLLMAGMSLLLYMFFKVKKWL